jgi:prepilin signal peptidase PulO-like enzyme (type II secretory pathway)
MANPDATGKVTIIDMPPQVALNTKITATNIDYTSFDLNWPQSMMMVRFYIMILASMVTSLKQLLPLQLISIA